MILIIMSHLPRFWSNGKDVNIKTDKYEEYQEKIALFHMLYIFILNYR